MDKILHRVDILNQRFKLRQLDDEQQSKRLTILYELSLKDCRVNQVLRLLKECKV